MQGNGAREPTRVGATSCPTCSGPCPRGARFCPSCGTPIIRQAPHAVERRTVTTLFCDLVGFTTLCETNDPEIVDRFLHDYYKTARGVIERFGGVVEKFIGDAVLGLFGAPKAHEDDAERAVRSGLHLVEQIAGLPALDDWRPTVRVGITTGEAIVRLTVDPSSGEGLLVGDPVNTAARLQAAAPPACVVVGEETHALTAHVIDYSATPAARLKGKAEPVPAWIARRPIATYGVDLRRDFSTPLVGREAELDILTGLFDAAVDTSSPRFVLITGDAGQGKTRLVAELARSLDERPGLMCLWRQGRCAAYAQESAYQPLAEIVMAHAGILESDDVKTTTAKLETVLRDSPDSEWLQQGLRPLLGLEAPSTSRDEGQLVWRRFIETVARTHPAVLVFEDLHWATSGMAGFLQMILHDLTAVPLLVVCTARPEVDEVHPSLANDFPVTAPSLARSVRVELSALSPRETERLVRRLGASTWSPDVYQTIVRNCAGNALYAEELARWFREGLGKGQAPTILPRSLEALIAARLDALPDDCSELLADAAVMGETFWAGPLPAMAHRSQDDVDLILCRLTERELVRPCDSSIEGEHEFGFWHGLTRDVAYRRLTRAARAEKHAAIGDWLGRHGLTAGVGVQLLAHHYATALDLAQAVAEHGLASRLLRPAVEALATAGQHALALDVETAELDLSRAVSYLHDDDPRRRDLVMSWADALSQKGELAKAVSLYEEAIEAMSHDGETRKTAVCLARLSRLLYLLGDDRSDETCTRALALVEQDEASPEKAEVLEYEVWRHSIRYEAKEATEAADRVLVLSRELGQPVPLRALGWRGMARCDLGDRGGLDDMREAVRQGIERGLGSVSTSVLYNLADEVHAFEGPRAAIEVIEKGLRLAVRRGDVTSALFLKAILAQELCASGEWDRALLLSQEIKPDLERSGQAGDLYPVMLRVAYIRSQRGETLETSGLAAMCQALLDPGERMDCWSLLAAVEVAAGHLARAAECLAEVLRTRESLPCRLQTGMALAIASDAAWQIGDLDAVRRLADGEDSRALDQSIAATADARLLQSRTEWAKAAAAYKSAAEAWESFGAPYHGARALLGQGTCLGRLGERPEAEAATRIAEKALRSLGAECALREVPSALRALSQSSL